jgi:hypothetical protein
MTIDPSSIPNFGAPVPPQGPPPIIKPDAALLAQLLDQVGLKYGTDAEGDLVASWNGFRVYLMFRGDNQELFAVRSFYEREYPVEEKNELLDVIDEWNRDTLWPKVYTHTNEEGVVRLIGESQMTIPAGVNIDFFVATTVNWIQAAVGFDGWLADRLGLAAEVQSVGGTESTEGTENAGGIETVNSSLLNEAPRAEAGTDAEAEAGTGEDEKHDKHEKDRKDQKDQNDQPASDDEPDQDKPND